MDAEGLSREFWRLLVQQAVSKYCVGPPGSCLFMKNMPALQVSVQTATLCCFNQDTRFKEVLFVCLS